MVGPQAHRVVTQPSAGCVALTGATVVPDYMKAIARIVSAVAPYPQAREAVIAALRDLEAESAPPAVLEHRRSEGAVVDG